jgi:hypothetical protein
VSAYARNAWARERLDNAGEALAKAASDVVSSANCDCGATDCAMDALASALVEWTEASVYFQENR